MEGVIEMWGSSVDWDCGEGTLVGDRGCCLYLRMPVRGDSCGEEFGYCTDTWFEQTR